MPILRVPIGVDGPVIDLAVWVGRSVAHGLIAQGQSVLPPRSIRALIDTGANRTAIHPLVLASIGSLPTGQIQARRPGSSRRFQWLNHHEVRLALGGIPTPPADPAILALIGRDLLARCQFLYDGPNRLLQLVF